MDSLSSLESSAVADNAANIGGSTIICNNTGSSSPSNMIHFNHNDDSNIDNNNGTLLSPDQ